MPKVQRTKRGQRFVYLPGSLADALGWDKGTDLSIFPNGKGAKIQELKKRGKGGASA